MAASTLDRCRRRRRRCPCALALLFYIFVGLQRPPLFFKKMHTWTHRCPLIACICQRVSQLRVCARTKDVTGNFCFLCSNKFVCHAGDGTSAGAIEQCQDTSTNHNQHCLCPAGSFCYVERGTVLTTVQSRREKVGFIENTAMRHRWGGGISRKRGPKGLIRGKPKGTLETESRNAIL